MKLLPFAVALITGFFPTNASAQVHLGVDILAETNFQALQGKKVGLITNHTGRASDGRSTIDLLHETEACDLVALFCPEHGIRGTEDANVNSSTDEKTGLPIHSLYGKTRKPTPEMLEGLEVLVFDIQDIGTRFYTYIGTMALAMEAAKEAKIEFMVLDRPNPIGGVRVEGAVPPKKQCGGLTSIYPIPTRHGMTVGELAQLFNDEYEIGCNLNVVPMKGWKRSMYFDKTGLTWIPTSPNMRTLNGAICYPGIGVLEGTSISCGRGTDQPFEMYGAPYLNAEKVAADLNSQNLPGVRFDTHPFTPTAKGHKFQGQPCQGILVTITDRTQFDPILTGLHFIQTIHRHHPTEYTKEDRFATLIGDPEVWKELTEVGVAPESILEGWKPELERFKKTRQKYLIPEYKE
ncbi:MAG: DUF1343 domain-containing protein [Candidatus Omnitrophica bacterium]|nr:DUF1343 domain-containing protein [Candidatus Omnitrophota bacterium]